MIDLTEFKLVMTGCESASKFREKLRLTAAFISIIADDQFHLV
jgi:hypothetical protein